MTELNPLTMTIELLGGLALFLYGMEKMQKMAVPASAMNTEQPSMAVAMRLAMSNCWSRTR